MLKPVIAESFIFMVCSSKNKISTNFVKRELLTELNKF
jgi:hypothetical protein